MGLCFESAHTGCTYTIYLSLTPWNQNNNPDNHYGIFNFHSSFEWKHPMSISTSSGRAAQKAVPFH